MDKVYSQKLKSTYQCWSNMKTRCFNPNDKFYKNYGGRGITVCDRWLKFNNFLNDMGIKPKDRSLDRIDNDGNYEPFNCRWANREEQSTNRGTPKGYTWNKYHGKYEAKIKKNYKRTFLGYFDSPEDAQATYLKARGTEHKTDNRSEVVRRLHNIWESIHAISR